MNGVNAPSLTTRPGNLSEIANSSGMTYSDFHRKLSPKYHWVGLQLCFVYISLMAVALLLMVAMPITQNALSIFVAGAFGGMCFGYLFAALSNFFHEALHYNLSRNRTRNDLYASLFLCPILGLKIDSARPFHFAHHQHLGTDLDEEISYRTPLNLRSLFDALFAIKIFTYFFSSPPPTTLAAKRKKKICFSSLAFHALVVGLSLLFQYWALALAWILGMISFFPLFVSLRQTLEHRPYPSEAMEENQSQTPKAAGRIFGAGPIASSLGCAGFNRHLLHHWEPQISYTRLKDLEHFLLDTEVARILISNQTTYMRTFSKLFQRPC